MITLEQMKEQKREVDDRWQIVLAAQREAVEAEKVWRKMMCEYYRSENDDDGTDSTNQQ